MRLKPRCSEKLPEWNQTHQAINEHDDHWQKFRFVVMSPLNKSAQLNSMGNWETGGFASFKFF